ncbi:MAG: hypothetical protein ACRD4I_10420 [Candidatus Angelobacter sp.]|jgi:hypothetical protein
MIGKQLLRMEEAGMVDSQRKGLLIMTLGKVLLGFDGILLAFVYVGIRSGSFMYTWWVAGQGLLGLILLAIGSSKRGSLSE